MQEGSKLFKDADSRLKGYFGQVTHPTLNLKRTYCFLCGEPAGYCSMESSEHVAPQHIVVTCSKCDEIMIGLGAEKVPQSILDAFGLVEEPVETKETGICA